MLKVDNSKVDTASMFSSLLGYVVIIPKGVEDADEVERITRKQLDHFTECANSDESVEDYSVISVDMNNPVTFERTNKFVIPVFDNENLIDKDNPIVRKVFAFRKKMGYDVEFSTDNGQYEHIDDTKTYVDRKFLNQF